jgi:hypothetical protein
MMGDKNMRFIITITIFLSILFSSTKSYSISIVKMSGSDDYWEHGILSPGELIYKFDNDFGLYLKGNVFSEDAILRYYGYGSSVSICFEEEEYDYYTNEYKTSYSDCKSATAYLKMDGYELFKNLPSGAIMLNSYGDEITNDIDVILIPCDNSCFP